MLGYVFSTFPTFVDVSLPRLRLPAAKPSRSPWRRDHGERCASLARLFKAWAPRRSPVVSLPATAGRPQRRQGRRCSARACRSYLLGPTSTCLQLISLEFAHVFLWQGRLEGLNRRVSATQFRHLARCCRRARRRVCQHSVLCPSVLSLLDCVLIDRPAHP